MAIATARILWLVKPETENKVKHIAYSIPAESPATKRYGVESPMEPSILHAGVMYSGTDKLGRLCRVLLDGELAVLDAHGGVRYTVDVSSRARKSLTESKKRGLKYVEYKEMPKNLHGE